MSKSRRVGQADFKDQLKVMRDYIRTRASRLVGRSVLFGLDDLVQESTIVLWKVLREYPEASTEELVKLFKMSLTHRYASMFRMKRVKIEKRMHSLDSIKDEPEKLFRVTSKEVLPWDFFRHRLAQIATRLDKESYAKICYAPSRINDLYLRRKEDALKEII
jgi:DNA-directed RNA polymerase specialized sigma24 family protein